MFIEILSFIFLCGGFFFLLVALLGMLRLPDVLTRMHAMSKCDTLGAGLILLGLFLLQPELTEKVKIVLVIFLIAVINPVVTHLIARIVYSRRQRYNLKINWTVDDSFHTSNNNGSEGHDGY